VVVAKGAGPEEGFALSLAGPEGLGGIRSAAEVTQRAQADPRDRSRSDPKQQISQHQDQTKKTSV
jgi:hypothetical protein